MSASQEPDISDIHATTVVETLSVQAPSLVAVHPIEVGGVSLTSDETVGQPLTVNVTIPNDAHPQIPSVGASISVANDSPSVTGMTDRASNALLSIASNSLNLTEILNAQQQALEQFQCQLQLAQQTEAINQRLDAIERTLNSLIQQRAQEEATKTHHHHHPVADQEADDLQVQAQVQLNAALSSTPIRPSQQLQMSITENMGLGEPKKKKLPRDLCVSPSKYTPFLFTAASLYKYNLLLILLLTWDLAQPFYVSIRLREYRYNFNVLY